MLSALLAWFASLWLELAYRLTHGQGNAGCPRSDLSRVALRQIDGFVLIRARAGPESEQYGLSEEASASSVYVQCWFELDPVFCTAEIATVPSVCVCPTLCSAALILQLLTVLY